MKNLVIVESPAKAKTIEKFLGKDFVVESSYGHIRDLIKKDKGVDIKAGFQPIYQVSDGSRPVVAKLRKLAKQSEAVWLATDEDREGEAIAWHIAEVLGLDQQQSNRITFNEITKKAVSQAIRSPRKIDADLVNAQQARRVLDRLVGFELSPVLWKKVRAGLSAGRVQSVAVRLIVERVRAREQFEAVKKWHIEADFVHAQAEIKSTWSQPLSQQADVEVILKQVLDNPVSVLGVQKKPGKRSPQATLTTSLLQQSAASAFGFSVSRTMRVAQRLYEAGHITYMRTDSQHLSEQAIQSIGNWIKTNYGQQYYQQRRFKTKAANAQEAHEAIRPTNVDKVELTGLEADQIKLYRLIWQRTLMSQMAAAKILKTEINLGWQDDSWRSNLETKNEGNFIAQGEIVEFDGWMVLAKSIKQKLLPSLEIGQLLSNKRLYAREVFTRPPAYYTEASLVKTLEELGIGRPSTYAPTISTIQDRGYVINEEVLPKQRSYASYSIVNKTVLAKQETEQYGASSRCLQPTDIAFVVNDFLLQQFPDILDYDFTARLEADFDHIAEKKGDWQKMLADFYQPFHQRVGEAERIERQKINHTRILGSDPKTGRIVSVKIGRYGPMVQMGQAEDQEKPQFASLLKSQKLDTISLAEALELFKLPRLVGQADRDIRHIAINNQAFLLEKGSPIKANRGRFGAYLQYGPKQFVSLKEFEPETIGLAEAMQVIDAKLKTDAEKLLAEFESIQVLKGRWGPYATDGSKNVSIAKGCELSELTLEQLKSLLKERGKPIKKRAKAAKKS